MRSGVGMGLGLRHSIELRAPSPAARDQAATFRSRTFRPGNTHGSDADQEQPNTDLPEVMGYDLRLQRERNPHAVRDE